MTYTIDKPGIGQVTIEMNACELHGDAAISIKYQINGGDPAYAEKLDDKHRALVFWTPRMINGKKTSGFVLPNYDEIKAAHDAMLSEHQAKLAADKAARIEALKSGAQPLDMRYYDGEYLSGYCAYGESADMLLALGLAKMVDGWGCLVDHKLIDALGDTITYPQAVEYAQPAIDAKSAAKAAKDAERAAIFEAAAKTGIKQLLRQWSEECNDPREDCSMDMVYEYAMPDGTTRRERIHTW